MLIYNGKVSSPNLNKKLLISYYKNPTVNCKTIYQMAHIVTLNTERPINHKISILSILAFNHGLLNILDSYLNLILHNWYSQYRIYPSINSHNLTYLIVNYLIFKLSHS